MISQLDIRVNGRSIQNVSQDSFVYNGKLYTRRGYPASNYDTTLANTDLNNKQARLYDR